MGTNIDRPTDGGERAGDDTWGAGPDGPPRRDAEAARQSFAADERAAETGRERSRTQSRSRSRDRERGENDWSAVGLVTSLGATCLFGVGGVLARSVHLTAVTLAFVAVGLLLARRWWRRRG